MAQLKALLWDVDGTLAETERDGHCVAFNQAFQACGLPWYWDEAYYGELLRITGGRERVLQHMVRRGEGPASAGAHNLAVTRKVCEFAHAVGVSVPLHLHCRPNYFL